MTESIIGTRRAEAGLYRLRPSANDALVVEVSDEGRIFCAGSLAGGADAVLRIPEPLEALQIRLWGETAAVDASALELLLADTTPAPPKTLLEIAGAIDLQRWEPAAAFHLVHRLAESGAGSEAEALRARFLASRPPAGGRQEAGSEEGAVRIFDLWSLGPEDKAELLRRGYEPTFLEATRLHRDLGEPRRGWQRAADPAVGELRFASAQLQRLSQADFDWQVGIARGEGLGAYCPATGRALRSRHGFCQVFDRQAFLFYRFEGEEVFYVVTGALVNGKNLIYLPRTRTLVLTSIRARWFDNEALIRSFEATLEAHADEVERYLSAPTRPAAIVGGDGNLGHLIWYDLTGLANAVEGVAPSLAEVIELTPQLIDLPGAFPELAPKARGAAVTRDDVFAHCLRQNLLPVRLTDAVIQDDVAERLVRSALAGSAASVPADARRPLLWINLRAHDKVWRDQAEGYASILNALAEEHGAVSAFLDGWTDCRPSADELARRVGPGVTLFDGLGFKVADSLVWAQAVDAYICTVGSGLVLLTWLSAKPGVAHADVAHLKQMEWWGDVRPGAPVPLHPSPDDIHEIEGSGRDGGAFYADYQVDWRLLLKLLRQALARAN